MEPHTSANSKRRSETLLTIISFLASMRRHLIFHLQKMCRIRYVFRDYRRLPVDDWKSDITRQYYFSIGPQVKPHRPVDRWMMPL